jgi:alkylated DNA repair dioxygenase AlkB
MKFLDLNALLPESGFIQHWEQIYEEDERSELFIKLQKDIPWRSQKIKIFGKEVNEPRLVAWYGDADATYTYSGLKLNPLPWTEVLISIKNKVETITEQSFNSVLLNFYRHGSDYMGWHSDNEKELGKNPMIASLSLGETRTFQLKPRKERGHSPLSIPLESGSLLLMGGAIQHCWKHRISPSKKDLGPRINLTFRLIKPF